MGKKRDSEQNPESGGAADPNSEEKKKKKRPNEIDEIFSVQTKKKKQTRSEDLPKDEIAQEISPIPKETKRKKKSKKKTDSKNDDRVDPPARARRKTADGFTVYSADEIGFNRSDAGGTPLCPFDCSCCF